VVFLAHPVCISGFMDDVMFAHNGQCPGIDDAVERQWSGMGLTLWRIYSNWPTRASTGPGTESDIYEDYDCLVAYISTFILHVLNQSVDQLIN